MGGRGGRLISSCYLHIYYCTTREEGGVGRILVTTREEGGVGRILITTREEGGVGRVLVTTWLFFEVFAHYAN
jgi:hypothetical protein